jgi:hypothetical protein
LFVCLLEVDLKALLRKGETSNEEMRKEIDKQVTIKGCVTAKVNGMKQANDKWL